jgi:predicted Zn-dependent peptidase
MGNLARQWMNFGRFFTLDELAASIDAVTAAEIQSIADEFFRPEKIGLVLLGRLNGETVTRDELFC